MQYINIQQNYYTYKIKFILKIEMFHEYCFFLHYTTNLVNNLCRSGIIQFSLETAKINEIKSILLFDNNRTLN